MGDKVGNGLREELAEDATPFCTGPGKILPTSLNAEERVVFAHVLEVLHPTAKLGGRQGEVRLNVGTEVVVLVDESDVVARGVVVPVTQRAVSATSTQLCGFANSPRAEAFGGVSLVPSPVLAHRVLVRPTLPPHLLRPVLPRLRHEPVNRVGRVRLELRRGRRIDVRQVGPALACSLQRRLDDAVRSGKVAAEYDDRADEDDGEEAEVAHAPAEQWYGRRGWDGEARVGGSVLLLRGGGEGSSARVLFVEAHARPLDVAGAGRRRHRHDGLRGRGESVKKEMNEQMHSNRVNAN